MLSVFLLVIEYPLPFNRMCIKFSAFVRVSPIYFIILKPIYT